MEEKYLYLHIKISEKLKRELKEEASKMELPLNSYIKIILMNRDKPSCSTQQK